MSDPRAALVAGEASGDLLAGLLLQGMRRRWPGLQSTGIGGPQMELHGFLPQWPYEKLAVRGYVEVLRQYREIVGIRNQLRERLLRERPDVFIGVDAPDFNLGLEEQLRKAGVPTVHFVCPSIWAWRMKRVEKLRRSCDHVLCVFPFEPELLAKHGVAATYVGHPLASVIPMEPDKAAARTTLGLPATGEVVALLPGSRASEVEALAARFLAAAAVLQKQRPEAWFVIPAMPALQARISQLARSGPSPRHLTIVTGRSHAALAACDVALVASGTATLETALF
ncbi:MAG TPA: lipid-A-disaccharide synthase, partial [Ramlibacter sp.]|nr:lipid-A-disaccharide synthase [Ramlibacter sp.]